MANKLSNRRVAAIIEENVDINLQNVELTGAVKVRDKRIAKLKDDKEVLLARICELEHGVTIKYPGVDIKSLHPPPEDFPLIEKKDKKESANTKKASSSGLSSKSPKKTKRTKSKTLRKDKEADDDALEDKAVPDDEGRNVQKSVVSKSTSSATGTKRKSNPKRKHVTFEEQSTSQNDVPETGSDQTPKKKKKKKVNLEHSSSLKVKMPFKTKTTKPPSTTAGPSSSSEEQNNNISIPCENIVQESTEKIIDSPDFTSDDECTPFCDVDITNVVADLLHLEDQFEDEAKEEIIKEVIDDLLNDIADEVMFEAPIDGESENGDSFTMEMELDSDDEFFKSVKEESKAKAAKVAQNRDSRMEPGTSDQNVSHKSSAKKPKTKPTPSSSRHTAERIPTAKSPSTQKKAKDAQKNVKKVVPAPTRPPSSRSSTKTIKQHLARKIKDRDTKKAIRTAKKEQELKAEAVKDPTLPTLSPGFKIPKKKRETGDSSSATSSAEDNINNNS